MTALQRENTTAPGNSKPDSANHTDPNRLQLILVDDDDGFREAAVGELEYHGFAVESFPDTETMLDHFRKGGRAHAIILDWKLATGLSIEALPQLRAQGITAPVIFLTGIPATAYETAALDHGAGDFVDKARGIPILAKRVRRVVETASYHATPQVADDLRCGALLLRPAASSAYWKGQDVDLTLTEFNVVYLLADAKTEYVSYRSIYDRVHHAGFIAGNGEDGYRTNVRSSIKRIRNKFRACDAQFSEIENFPAVGYRWRIAPDSAG